MNENALRREVRRLKRENEYLRGRIDSLGGGGKNDRPARLFAERVRASREKSFAGYIKSTFGASGVMRIYSRIFFALQSYIRASAVFSVVMFLVRLIRSGTVFLVAASALAMMLPVLLIAALIEWLIAATSRKSVIKRITSEAHGKIFLVYGDVRGRFARELAERGTVISVKGSALSCGPRGARKTRDGIWNVHIGMIFSLAEAICEKRPGDVIKIF